MTRTPRIYLAGPDVFLPDPLAAGARKKAICARHGLEGVFPMELVALPDGLGLRDQGLHIGAVMEGAMRDCDGIIVNLTPFHGPSADVGSAYEAGFMRALGKPVFAYSNDGRDFAERVAGFWSGRVRRRANGNLEGPDRMQIETFDLFENLMIATAVLDQGLPLFVATPPEAEYYTELEAFAEAVAAAAAHLLHGKALPGGPASS